MSRSRPPIARARLAALFLAPLLLGGCVPIVASPTSLPAPGSLAPAPGEVAQTAVALASAFRQVGIGFIRSQQPYLPSEPADLQAVPRTVYQEVLPRDPEAGYVVIYEAPNPAGAQTMAAGLRAYLQSGFGETNYPTDAQFAVSVYGATVVFGWYSPGASADAATAGRALGVLLAFGEPLPVVR